MAEQYSYPEREHIEQVTDLCDAMRFELSIHSDGEEFRQGVKTIGKLYESTSILRSMQQTARLMSLTRIAAGYTEYQNQPLDPDFLLGSTLALHTVIRVQEPDIRHALRMSDLYINHLNSEFTYAFSHEELKSIIDSLSVWSQGAFMDSLESEPEEFQELVISAAIRMYDDKPNFRANEDAFMAGFMMAKDQIVAQKDNLMKHRSELPPFKHQGIVL